MGKFELAGEIWSVVRSYIDPHCRQEAAKAVIEAVSGLIDCPQLKKDSETDPNDVVDDWAPDSCPYEDYDFDGYDDDGFYANDQYRYEDDHDVPHDRRD